jgi:CheY-like chemotaxis protein
MATILVVDDDHDDAVLVCSVLHKAGHRTLTAVDGRGALACARDWLPDLVVLEVSLAGPMSGLDVCRTIRGARGLEHMPVILLSGWAFDSDIEAGKEAGANAYLAKPFDPADLVEVVQGRLDRATA